MKSWSLLTERMNKMKTEKKKCVVCEKEVNIKESDLVDYYDECCAQADALGMESLTEHQQVLVEGLVCCTVCYTHLL